MSGHARALSINAPIVLAFAIHHIALLASEPQTLERPTMAINFDQIAGNEETGLLVFATYHPYQGLAEGQTSPVEICQGLVCHPYFYRVAIYRSQHVCAC